MKNNWLVGILLCFCFGSHTVQALPIQDANKRKTLGITFAPEIRQDQDEQYGFSSIAYFLQRSHLVLAKNPCETKKASKQNFAIMPGSFALLQKYFSLTSIPDCVLHFTPFEKTEVIHQKQLYWGATGNFFFQLRDHSSTTLLQGKNKTKVIPEVHFHAYESQGVQCKRRDWLGQCQEHEAKRFYVLQYFLTLMFNDACNQHEGEMEGMVVLIDATKYDAAQTPIEKRDSIQSVGTMGHYKTTLHPPSALQWTDVTHPVVFMGKGGHALFPKSGTTSMTTSFPFEIRKVVTTLCKRRNKAKELLEKHRGKGEKLQSWLSVPEEPFAFLYESPQKKYWNPWRGQWEHSPTSQKANTSPSSRPLSRPMSRAVAKKRLPLLWKKEVQQWKKTFLASDHKAFSAECILRKKRQGVRLCDVQANPSNPSCCLNQSFGKYVRWVTFAGRWGKQEPYASTKVSLAIAKMGLLLKRWPIGKSLGNSGPFGPPFIFFTTWNWTDPFSLPKKTPSTWR